jgi:hypothetical protein
MCYPNYIRKIDLICCQKPYPLELTQGGFVGKGSLLCRDKGW